MNIDLDICVKITASNAFRLDLTCNTKDAESTFGLSRTLAQVKISIALNI